MSPVLKSFWILCLCLPFCLFAQKDKIVTIELINEEDGMRNNIVRDVIVDSRGLIWMATPNGLHRYDGFSFTIYDNRVNSPVRLNSYNIYSVDEDKEGYLWLGTDNGISVLDVENQTLRKYFNEGNEKFPPIEGSIQSSKLLIDKAGTIWFLEGGVLGIYTKSEGFKYPFSEETPLLNDLMIDNKDHIYLINNNTGKRYILDENRTLYEPKSRIGFDSLSRVTPLFGPMFYDKDGQINFYQNGENIYTYNLEEDSLELIPFEENSLNHLVSQVLSRKLELNVLRLKSNHRKDFYKVLKVEKGGTNLFWIATNLGLLKTSILETGFGYDEQFDNKSLRGLYEHDNKNLYIGGYTPLNFVSYTPHNKAIKKKTRETTNVWDVTPWNEDTLILINDGLTYISLYDVTKEKVIYKKYVSKILKQVRATIVLDDGKVIFGSESGGLFHSQISNISNIARFNFETPDPFLDDIKVNCSYQESDSIFWIGTTSQIVQINVASEKVTKYDIKDLANDKTGSREIWDIYKSPKGDFWLATNDGLANFEPSTKKTKFFYTTDGLSDNLIYSILPQGNTALWLATNNGLSKLDIAQQKFYIYTEADGIRNSEFNRNSALLTKDGQMYFGGLNGFTSFYPSEIKKRDQSFKPFISSYSIYDRAKDKLVEYVPERKNGQTIHLDPDNRNITFRLGLTDYKRSRKASFDVMLQGFDKDWITIRNTNEIRYTNLNPDNYIFKVRATNAYGQTSSEEDYVRLVVVKPWYTSIWFYGLLISLIFASIIATYLSKINFERRTNRLRNRVANDLHDEVSNTLNNIRIVALDARREGRGPNKQDINKIESMSSYAIDHLQDVIWAIDLENRDIKYLIFRMQDNIDALLRSRSIPVDLKKVRLNEKATLNFLFRRNLLLIFKEALSNIVKHSITSKVIITIGNIDGHFTLSVKNFIEQRIEAPFKTGRGTISMTQRAMALKGRLEVKDTEEAYEVVLVLNKSL